MSEQYQRFDPADYINGEDDVRWLLKAAADEDLGDGVVIRAALKYVARTQNMSALARDAGINRGNLYKALSEEGNPTLSTLLKVTGELGLKLLFEAMEKRTSSAERAVEIPHHKQASG